MWRLLACLRNNAANTYVCIYTCAKIWNFVCIFYSCLQLHMFCIIITMSSWKWSGWNCTKKLRGCIFLRNVRLLQLFWRRSRKKRVVHDFAELVINSKAMQKSIILPRVPLRHESFDLNANIIIIWVWDCIYYIEIIKKRFFIIFLIFCLLITRFANNA